MQPRKKAPLLVAAAMLTAILMSSGAMAAEKPVIKIPTITEAELSKLEKRCIDETKTNAHRHTYSLITGKQVFSKLHPLPAGLPPFKTKVGTYQNEYYTYELHLRAEREGIYKVFLGSENIIENAKSIFVDGQTFGVCATLNSTNGRYGGKLETLAAIHD